VFSAMTCELTVRYPSPSRPSLSQSGASTLRMSGLLSGKKMEAAWTERTVQVMQTLSSIVAVLFIKTQVVKSIGGRMC